MTTVRARQISLACFGKPGLSAAAAHQSTMETEQSHQFNERLSQWVASQGFWFQLRYSLSGSGSKGRVMFHLLRLGSRVLIFLVLLSIMFWVFLLKRPESQRFRAAFRTDLSTALAAKEFELAGFQRTQGQFEISRLAAEGDENTFFTSLEARNIRGKMSLTDRLIGVWKPGIVAVTRLDVELRAGSNDPQAAAKFAEVAFRKSGKTEIESFEVAQATVRWGFSERTRGRIESSALKMQRTETGWRLSFKGGYFYQNWLKRMEIDRLVVLCNPDGLIFEEASLKRGSGTVDFAGLQIAAGEQPVVSGVAKIRTLALEAIVPVTLRNFIEGSISGDFRVFGSTNTSDGVGFEGQVVMDGEDVITLRDRFYILEALSVVDYSRNYHRVDLREGSFQMKTHGGGIELTEVDLKADDLFTMRGSVTVRLPTSEEIEQSVAKGTDLQVSPLFARDDEAVAASKEEKSESDFTLRRAAQEARRIQEGQQSPSSLSLFDRLGLSMEMRNLQNQASERMSRMLRYEGSLEITLPGDAFERAPQLLQLHPVDGQTGRIGMKVPLEGHLYELTLKQAEDIYEQGKR